jgi:serine/threonine protein kinase
MYYIHRDVKPDNFCIGKNEKENELYIIDFGISKRYIARESFKHIAYLEGKKFNGNYIFASIKTHQGIEPSRRSDLESIGYILVYFLLGELPWRGIKAKTKEENYVKIMEMKISTPLEVLCKGLPSYNIF